MHFSSHSILCCLLPSLLLVCTAIHAEDAVAPNTTQEPIEKLRLLSENGETSPEILAPLYIEAIKSNPNDVKSLQELFDLRNSQKKGGLVAFINDLRPLIVENAALTLKDVYYQNALLRVAIETKIPAKELEHAVALLEKALRKSDIPQVKLFTATTLLAYCQAYEDSEKLEAVADYVERTRIYTYSLKLQTALLIHYRCNKDVPRFIAMGTRLVDNAELYDSAIDFKDAIQLLDAALPGGYYLASTYIHSYFSAKAEEPIHPSIFAQKVHFFLEHLTDAPADAKRNLLETLEEIEKINDLRTEYLQAVTNEIAGFILTEEARSDKRVFASTMALLTKTLILKVDDDPADDDSRNALIGVYAETSQYDKAEELLKKHAYAENEKMPTGVILLVKSYLKNKNTPAAQEILRWAEESLQKQKDAGKMLFALYHTTALVVSEIVHDDEQALVLYRRAQAINTDDPVNNNNLAYTLALLGRDLDEALALSQQAIQAAHSPAYMLDTLAWIYYKKGNYMEALKVMRQCMAAQLQERQQKATQDNPKNSPKALDAATWRMDQEMREHYQAIIKALQLPESCLAPAK